MLRRLLTARIWMLGLAIPGIAGASSEPLPSGPATIPHAWVIFGSDTVRAEVANTPDSRARGLMGRTELAMGEGMLFVWSSEGARSFWMRDTPLALDIAFLDERQVVVDIQAMEPESDRLHDSAEPAMYALEVPRGWFAARGIGPGAQARIVFLPVAGMDPVTPLLSPGATRPE